VVGVVAFGKPGAPEVAGPLDVLLGLLYCARPAQLIGPGDRTEALLPLAHRVARMGPVALDAHAGVAKQPERRDPVGGVQAVTVLIFDVTPLGWGDAIVEHRLAHHLDLNMSLDAFDDPHEQVVGIEVSGGARVARVAVLVVPVADGERVYHAQPPLWGHPRRLDHVRAGQVAATDRHVYRVGTDPEAARSAVEHRGEHRGGVEVRQTHPLDRPVGGK
jgi:hypothetical protein